MSMYADNTSLSWEPKDPVQLNKLVNGDLKRIRSWMQGDKVSLNLIKTQCMLHLLQIYTTFAKKSIEKLGLEFQEIA